MTDNETRYREALEKISIQLPKDCKAYLTAYEALNPPQEPQFEEVEVVRWTSWCPETGWMDSETYNTEKAATATGHEAIKISRTCRRPVKPKVKQREEATIEELRRSSWPVDMKFYREWEE